MEPLRQPWVLVSCLVGFGVLLVFVWIQSNVHSNPWQPDTTAAITEYRA